MSVSIGQMEVMFLQQKVCITKYSIPMATTPRPVLPLPDIVIPNGEVHL